MFTRASKASTAYVIFFVLLYYTLYKSIYNIREYELSIADKFQVLLQNCHSITHYLLKEDAILYSNKEFLIEKLQEILRG